MWTTGEDASQKQAFYTLWAMNEFMRAARRTAGQNVTKKDLVLSSELGLVTRWRIENAVAA